MKRLMLAMGVAVWAFAARADAACPYAEPGTTYRSGSACGTSDNPYNFQIAYQYATPEHQGQYAFKLYETSCDLGQFSIPVTIFGKQKYQWSLVTQVDRNWCVALAATQCVLQ